MNKKVFAVFALLSLLLGLFAFAPTVDATEIFSDGFESGDFDEWTGITIPDGVTVEVSNAYAHHGAYSAHLANNDINAATMNVYKTIAGINEVWVRVYIKFTELDMNAGSYMLFLSLNGQSGWNVQLGAINSSGNKFYLRYYDGTSKTITSATAISVDTEYCVELHFKRGDGTGAINVYLNNIEINDLAVANNTRDNNVTGIYLGSYFGQYPGVNKNFNFFIDCVVVSDSYIGPETEEPPETLAVELNQPENASTITTLNCNFNYTPTIVGSDNFQNSSLIIDGEPVANNASAIANATLNTIGYTFAGNGTYTWNVRVYNSTNAVYASANFTLTVNAYEPEPTPTPTATPTGDYTLDDAVAIGALGFILALAALAYAATKK